MARLATRSGRLESVIALGRAMNAARSPVDLAESVAEEILQALPAASVSISRLEAERGLLRTLLNVGDLAPWERRRPLDETYPSSEVEVLRDPLNRPAAVYDLDDPDCPESEAHILRMSGKRTSLNVAILYAGQPWGELAATRRAEDPPFTMADLEYAEAVAGFVALAFAQAHRAEEVARLALQDPLTGLGNRRAVDAALDAAFDQHRGAGVPVSVVLCDVNDLKQVNDANGHAAGDDVLRRVGRAVASAAAQHPGAHAARIGGDEFCLVAPVGHLAATRLAELICAAAPRWPGEVPVAVGVAATDSPGSGLVDTPRRLLRLADAAQYRAKRTMAVGPVVAGRPVVGADPVDGDGPGRVSRRRPPMLHDALAAVAAAAAALAETGSDASADALERVRLRAAARAVAHAVGAAAWYLSAAPPGSDVLVTVEGLALGLEPDADTVDPEGAECPLADYRLTRAALTGAGFAVHREQVDADPAELAVLASLGYAAVVGAGVPGPSGTRWLLELYLDELGPGAAGLDLVLPGIMALAVLPAAEAGGGGAADRR